MKRPLFALALLCHSLSIAPSLAQWKVTDRSLSSNAETGVTYERITFHREGESGFFSSKRLQIAWFDAKTHTFRVIDNGAGDIARYSSIATAMIENGCVAGCNGGFFLKNGAPSGLMIADGSPTGTFGTGKLLSGVIVNSGKQTPLLLRRAEYGTHFQALDLIQTGPFLIDREAKVAGLSNENPRRRSFALHDKKNGFGIGLSSSLTLAQLSEVLSSPHFFPDRTIVRALNLDGGTSCGFYFGNAADKPSVRIEPIKKVRNFIGIVPREK